MMQSNSSRLRNGTLRDGVVLSVYAMRFYLSQRRIRFIWHCKQRKTYSIFVSYFYHLFIFLLLVVRRAYNSFQVLSTVAGFHHPIRSCNIFVARVPDAIFLDNIISCTSSIPPTRDVLPIWFKHKMFDIFQALSGSGLGVSVKFRKSYIELRTTQKMYGYYSPVQLSFFVLFPIYEPTIALSLSLIRVLLISFEFRYIVRISSKAYWHLLKATPHMFLLFVR